MSYSFLQISPCHGVSAIFAKEPEGGPLKTVCLECGQECEYVLTPYDPSKQPTHDPNVRITKQQLDGWKAVQQAIHRQPSA
jgi:thymidine kinase